MDVTTIQPTSQNEICCDQKAMSNCLNPHQFTAISIPLVTGSFFPTRSNIIFIVHCNKSELLISSKNIMHDKLTINIFHKQYKLKKCPMTLK